LEGWSASFGLKAFIFDFFFFSPIASAFGAGGYRYSSASRRFAQYLILSFASSFGTPLSSAKYRSWFYLLSGRQGGIHSLCPSYVQAGTE
jgi:hypothetical protein